MDDLRQGKHTVLLATAFARADCTQRRVLTQAVGRRDADAEDAAAVRRVLVATGAVDMVEHMIARRRDQALAALDQAALPASAREGLGLLADLATRRAA